MRIAIIGAGLMGLALAERLSERGHRIKVYERAQQPGGLATWQDFGRFKWDRFYHVILPSDVALISFIRRIGLGDELSWGRTRTGYYLQGQLLSLSSGWEFARFKPLSLWNKARLAWTILYCSRIDDWQALEQQTVEDFLTRLSGRATFESFWKPLLLAKLGEHYKRVSAVFIWTYVKRLFSARDATTQKEALGYVSGGYRSVFKRLEERIGEAGGELETGVEVSTVRQVDEGSIEISGPGHSANFDKVVFTGPVNVMRKVVDQALVEAPAAADVEYLGVICLVLVTKKPVVDFYVVNISDERIPFTGVIGMSSLVSTEETGRLHLTYFPKYVLSDDEMLRRSEADLRQMFMAGFKRMFPDFEESDIESVHLHRAVKVQPLQVLGYSRLVQTPRTLCKDFYVVNTAQFVNNTLNNNEVIRLVDSFMDEFGADFLPEN